MSASDRDAEQRTSNLDPEAIARTTFPTSFRGYDADHVRRFLEQVAEALRDAHDREAGLLERLEAVEAKLAAASRVDEDQLTAALGEETARVLTVAREAATDIKTKASDSAAQTLRDAEEHARTVRSDADGLMARRTEEVEAEAARIRAQVDAAVEGRQAEAERALDAARTDAERIRLEAAEAGGVEVEAARARGREMVDEALLVRARVLEDLARKRKASRVQLERLQAGRERLIDSYTIVQRTLDEANEELRTSLTSAKIAADAAARRVEAEPLPSPSELDREVEAARESPEYTEQLPHEELVPLEPSAEFEGVRIVDDPRPNGRRETTETAEIVEVVDVVEAADEEGDTAVDVDDLFARIRASREDDVAKAQNVLAREPSSDAHAAEEAGDASDASDAEPHAERGDAQHTEPEPAASEDEALLERRDAITDAVEKHAVRKLKRVLADEQNEVLDRLRRNPKARLDDLFPAAGEHSERYASVVGPHLVDVAQSGGTFYGATPAKTDVTDLANDLAQALTVPLRDRIDGSLREAAGDEEAMADGVRAVYRDWKTHRIESHTRDAVLAAFNRGLYDATDESTGQRWIVDNGGSPCPDAEDNSLAGLVVKGEPFPTGHCYPPAHPGCRCLLVAEPL
jgi:DivIVA domain-containing protein